MFWNKATDDTYFDLEFLKGIEASVLKGSFGKYN